jgi:hypothetical protein
MSQPRWTYSFCDHDDTSLLYNMRNPIDLSVVIRVNHIIIAICVSCALDRMLTKIKEIWSSLSPIVGIGSRSVQLVEQHQSWFVPRTTLPLGHSLRTFSSDLHHVAAYSEVLL